MKDQNDKTEFLEPWYSVDSNGTLEDELNKELGKDHILFGKKLKAIARREDNDDILFLSLEPPMFLAEVHLTWAGKIETNSNWPLTKTFENIEEWTQKSMIPTNLDFNN